MRRCTALAAIAASGEFENDLIDGETVARLGAYLGDLGVALGAQHILHLHGLDYGELLAGLDLLSLIDGEGDEEARHRRERKRERSGGRFTGIFASSAAATGVRTLKASVAPPRVRRKPTPSGSI